MSLTAPMTLHFAFDLSYTRYRFRQSIEDKTQMGISSPFLSMFGRSPIRPLEQHIDKAHRAAADLLPFFEAVYVENWIDAKEVQQRIATL
jgi:hypothetical protein